MTSMTEREAEELCVYIRQLKERIRKNNDKALAKSLLERIGIIAPENNDRKLDSRLQQALTVTE